VALLFRQCQQLLQARLTQSEQLLTELAQDELQLSPHPSELQQFSQQVHQLEARTEQLARQIASIKGN
jgi:ubiquinone biosynthesis protein UbiJ